MIRDGGATDAVERRDRGQTSHTCAKCVNDMRFVGAMRTVERECRGQTSDACAKCEEKMHEFDIHQGWGRKGGKY